MVEENLLRVLQDHKNVIEWSLADLNGIYPSMCMHRILLEDGHKPSIEAHRRINPTMNEVVRKEVLKWLDAGVIYPISDSLWVSLVQVVLKKGRPTVIRERTATFSNSYKVEDFHRLLEAKKGNKKRSFPTSITRSDARPAERA